MRNRWSCTRKKGWRNGTEKINLTLLILIYPRDTEDGDLKEKKAAHAVGAACSTAGCVATEVSRCRGRPLGAPISCLLADESKQKAPEMGQETRSWGAPKRAWPACCWPGVECQGEQGHWAQEDFPRLYWDVATRGWNKKRCLAFWKQNVKFWYEWSPLKHRCNPFWSKCSVSRV